MIIVVIVVLLVGVVRVVLLGKSGNSGNCGNSGIIGNTVIWLYFALKIFRTLLFCAVLISYAPDIVYETRVKVSLLKNIRAFNFRTDGSVRN